MDRSHAPVLVGALGGLAVILGGITIGAGATPSRVHPNAGPTIQTIGGVAIATGLVAITVAIILARMMPRDDTRHLARATAATIKPPPVETEPTPLPPRHAPNPLAMRAYELRPR